MSQLVVVRWRGAGAAIAIGGQSTRLRSGPIGTSLPALETAFLLEPIGAPQCRALAADRNRGPGAPAASATSSFHRVLLSPAVRKRPVVS